MKIVLMGAQGQLGNDLKRILVSKDLIPLTHKDIEITDYNQVSLIIKSYLPDIVINTTAYHKVDECENNPEETFKVNTLGVRNLALVCKDCNATLVHFSTDYVFDGKKKTPYTELDTANPINVYGISKLAGEYFIRYILNKYFIVRTSGLFGLSGSREKGGNFVEKMLSLAKEKKEVNVVNDQFFSPTYTLDLAKKVGQLIFTDFYGIYHITNGGSCSWYEFTKRIFQLAHIEINLKETTSEEFVTPAKRPKYSVLENHQLETIRENDLRTWEEALKAYLEKKERKNKIVDHNDLMQSAESKFIV